jgi:hypothetical protein
LTFELIYITIGFMAISPENLNYEEHSLLGSNFPRPERHGDLYIVQRKLVLPVTRVRSIIRHRQEQGRIAMGMMSAVLDFGDLIMNLEDLDTEGRTIRSPRIYSLSDEDLTQPVYESLFQHPVLGANFRPLLRSEWH